MAFVDPSLAKHRNRSRWRSLFSLGLGFIALAVVAELVYIFGLGNLREVIPGRLYRAGQPSSSKIKKYASNLGIKTIFNLKGCCDPTPWYVDEAGAAQDAGISLEEFSFSAGRLPPPPTLKRLVEAIEGAEEPLLVHCHQGIDRTGMVVALWLLLKTQTPPEEAVKELSLRYMHLPWGRTGNLDNFLAWYQEWLKKSDRPHSPKNLKEWLTEVYVPGFAKATYTQVEPNAWDIPQNTARNLVLRVKNHSERTWDLSPGINAGIHLFWYVVDRDHKVVHAGLSGLFDAKVAPGESIDLSIPIHANLPPGEYLIRADMDEPSHARFAQTGQTILETPLRIIGASRVAQNDSKGTASVKVSQDHITKAQGFQGRNTP
jgi:protein tyrosine phosphatase (PTP) superfamily phosphohydrolase (DUF442 family)